MKRKKKKREYAFEVGDLVTMGVTLAVTGVVLAFALNVQADIKSDIFSSDCSDQGGYENATSGVCQASSTNATNIYKPTAEFNGSTDSITGVAKLPAKLPLIATVIVAIVVIGLLIRYFRA